MLTNENAKVLFLELAKNNPCVNLIILIEHYSQRYKDLKNMSTPISFQFNDMQRQQTVTSTAGL